MTNTETFLIRDNYLSNGASKVVHNYCLQADYFYGEQDNCNTPITGLTHTIPENNIVFQILAKANKKAFGLDTKDIKRAYINCYGPSEFCYYHQDEFEKTFLYYPLNNSDRNSGGETLFIRDEEIYGVFPKSNRGILFDAHIPHKATPFKVVHRFTIAVKY